jgi:hypothetical protein
MLKPMLLVPAAVMAAAMPTSAAASSLLSGYGGPGQGNQAILGSTLLNGRSNGGGGSSSGGGSAGSGSASLANLAAPSTRPALKAHRSHTAGRRSSSSAARGKKAAGTGGLAAASGAGAYPASTPLRSASAGSGALGISGADLLYIILAFGAVLLTGVLTRQLMRGTDARGGPAAKGMRRRTRGTL